MLDFVLAGAGVTFGVAVLLWAAMIGALFRDAMRPRISAADAQFLRSMHIRP